MERRQQVLADTKLRGVRLTHALCEATDEWIREVWTSAFEAVKVSKRVALVAVGGYGRGELAPYSDLDIMLIHDGAKNIDDLASKIWYPIWDSGLKLGHSVCTVKQATELAKSELDAATALLSVRLLAGDESLANELSVEGVKTWKAGASNRLPQLMQRVRDRQQDNGEVAFLLEPNLKEGYGGLRDIHALIWAEAAGVAISRSDRDALDAGRDVLMAVRVALHRHVGRAVEVMHLEDQDAVASLCGYRNADALVAALSNAGRSVSWVGDEVWARVAAAKTKPVADQLLAPGVILHLGEIHLEETVDPATDPTLLLRVAASAARHKARIDRPTLDRLAQSCPPMPSPWPVGAIDDFVGLLLTAHDAIPVLEALDQRGLWVKVLPEWAPNRSKPQRNAYHRFTVDRHLWEATANAATWADRVARPDLLVLGALFHDIGKGYPGDHTEVGVAMVEKIGPRLGLNADDTQMICAMVKHHLLLPDVATRRDLADSATIMMVADEVKTPLVLDLLHGLTEADSLATGTAAWGTWKAELVSDLVRRVHLVLGGAEVEEAQWRLFPDAEVLEMMAGGTVTFGLSDDSVTVVSPDRPGTFSRVAGVLALHGLGVLGAQAHSDEQGMAASQFRVIVPSHGPIEWQPIVQNLTRALNGELAIEARMAERAKTYRRKRRSAGELAPPRVTFFDEASSNATVIEVRAPDQHGILHRVTKAMAEVGLDIRHATVQTIGDEVVDAFYVRTSSGSKLTDKFHRQEVERAILFSLAS
ncbi:MAG: protein-PII uridylyltransferase GlnD [Actinomycetota bacterium]|jgi:[protein-PII] uridylyltransferase